MQDRPTPPPWQPAPFSVAVLDADETLCDALCALLRQRGFEATACYHVAAFLAARQRHHHHAYVLDVMADWPADGKLLEQVVGEIAGGPDAGVPVFVLGNHAAPEQAGTIGELLMRYKLRYQLRPIRADYLARQIVEAVAARAGI